MSGSRSDLASIRQAGRDALLAGAYDSALALSEEGLAISRSSGHRDLEDVFFCNRAAVLLELNRFDFDFAELKRVILRDPGSLASYLASANAALVYQLRGDLPRATFYGRLAYFKSRDLGSEEWISASLNLLGVVKLAESRFERARELFAQALERLEADGLSRTWNAGALWGNIGYCHIASGRIDVGIPQVRHALSVLEDLGADQATDCPCLDLCLAELKRGRLDDAERWGARALELGNRFERRDVVKNALYLLAETSSRMGDGVAADRYYDRLAAYYPDLPSLKEWLKTYDVVDLLNLP